MKKMAALLKSVEQGSFTEAARSMTYSPSSVSRMIGELEAEWDVTLLKRGRNGVSLTPAGLLLMPYIRNVHDEYLHLYDKISELNDIQLSKLRIGAIASVAAGLLPDAISSFQAGHPHVKFEIVTGSCALIEQLLLGGKVDVGFLPLPALSRKLDVAPLMQERLLAVLPEDHPLVGMERFPVERIPDFPFILLREDGLSEAERYLRSIRIAPSSCTSAGDGWAVALMVEKGMGISILPGSLLERSPCRVVTKELSIPARQSIGSAVRDRDEAPKAVAQFLDAVRAIHEGRHDAGKT